MAGLRKLKNQYYARIHMPKDHDGPGEVKVPLRTDNEALARERRIEVEKREEDIKSGLKLTFPWLNEKGTVEVVHLSLSEAIGKYLKAVKADRLSYSTQEIYKLALTHFKSVIGSRFALEKITTQRIDKFKQVCVDDTYATDTINIRLRAIKTFLRWCHDREMIKAVPKIKLLNGVDRTPRYLSNHQFDSICKQVDPFLKRVFQFYRETGCRLSEPFNGEINGSFLTITAETSKTHRSRDVYLTPELKSILIELREKTHTETESNSEGRTKPIRDTHQVKYYSKVFQDACKKAGVIDRPFHSLRHTAAVRTYLNTRDIYEVARLLGHANVTTTQIYAKFDIKRLEQDFPDLVKDSNREPAYSVSG